jgi:subtilisin family serine protease
MPKRTLPKKRTKSIATDTSQEPTPIFTSGVSNVVPGELLIQLDEGTAESVTTSIPRGPARGVAFEGPSTFGVAPLDQALAQLKVTSITRLHPPAPVVSTAREAAVPLASTFRVAFDAGTPVEQAAKRLTSVPGVQFVEPNRYRETFVTPNDPSFPAQWGLAKIDCPSAWDITRGSANIVVAVIDTGVDLDHPELAPLLVQGTDMVDLGPNPTAPAGFRFEGDFQGRDNVPQDDVGHGTHVAGTIACATNNGTGVAGVTWDCRLMPVRVLARIVNITNPADVRGVGSTADIAAGIRWAVDNGARILNLSLGGSVDTQVERDAIAYAVARGAVVVAAMGNGGPNAGPSFPAAYPDVIAVASIDQADHRAPSSQVGPHIDVSAPGVGILSTVWNNGFATFSGTSMASPHVAGVAALVLSCNNGLTAAQVGDILRQTARPLRDNPADPVPNNNYGFGCVNARAALERACPLIPLPTRPIATCPAPSLICPVSRPIATCPAPTVAPVTCNTRPFITCPAPSVAPITCNTRPFWVCPPSRVLCPPRRSNPLITCPTPSIVVRCPSGPLCGIGGRPEPGDPAPGGFSGDVPAGDWEQGDPYGADYGDDCGCGKHR